MKLIDTHAHLDHIENLDQALHNAREAGISGVVAVSESLESCLKNLDIKKTKKDPKIYLAMGIHPSEANLDDLDACADLIRKQRDHLTAIGEIGLDFWYKWVRKDQQKKDVQRKVFRAFLDLARELDLPAVVHTRGTWREAFETVKEAGIRKAEFHWYSGPLDVLKDIIDAGYYVSASPSLAMSAQAREAIDFAPIERVMIETDSPVHYREEGSEDRFQAEPKDVFRTLKAYCMLKGVEESAAAEIFNQNARAFFDLD